MEAKQLAGEKAAEAVESGMTVGLGTGSTVHWAILKLGERVRSGLQIRGVATSERTRKLAEELGIPLLPLAEAGRLDVTIDGADEVDPGFNLIKGGGGALFREKMVAVSSARLIIVADESKLVPVLGSFLLPVEVVPFAWETTLLRVADTGCTPKRRAAEDGSPYLTDNGNYILDCDFKEIADPAETHRRLKMTVGVVETGLFLGMADTVIVGGDRGVRVLNRDEQRL